MSSIEKFIIYLANYLKNLKEKDIDRRKKEYYEAICMNNKEYKFIESGESKLVSKLISELLNYKQNEGFINFSLLSIYMINSNLSIKEQFEVIDFLIKHNIELDIPNRYDNIKLEEIRNDKFIDISKNLFYETISRLEKEDNENISNHNQKITEINIFLNQTKNKKVKFINAHELYLKYYINKETLDEEDINNICTAYKELEIEEVVVGKIKYYLSKLNKKNPILKFNNKVDSNKENKQIITDKEYKKIKKELNGYFDFKNFIKIKKLNNNEIIRCLELLIKIGESDKNILKFIKTLKIDINEYRNNSNLLLENENPISYYNSIYDKLLFYKDRLVISDEIEMINYYISEMMIADDDSYIICKENIKELLIEINNKLSPDYEYEISKIMKKKIQ